jgi:Tfp pilus assembly protein PilZ
MNIPEIKYQKYNIVLAQLLNLIIDLNEEQQSLLLKEVEEKFLEEKRGYIRRARSIPVRYINKDRIFTGFIINFSQGGCFIKADDPLFVGEEILMDIGLDCYNKAIRIKGIVAHVNRLGVGIKYKEIITIDSEV